MSILPIKSPPEHLWILRSLLSNFPRANQIDGIPNPAYDDDIVGYVREDIVAGKNLRITAPMINRVELRKNGNLDEVVTDGGAHLERLNKETWFLNCVRADGTSIAIFFRGTITSFEERK